ncbi:hypothetical protein EVB55_211 [Rhizobium phage RHph_Y68]|uniref:Uncharacterized protein n=1 Tax=Rhizobium phage RHph_Y68 TaxID=2509787 RepID=A0A7S5R3L1_9CAUD|nr:hypothetical protein PP934_gp211 [Rhizobium phage RHph_Y68]QIG68146.1 hypothetical protein EVB55_211 [Rhizobium phage RHph_Y68]
MPVQVIKWKDDLGNEFDTYDEAVESNELNKPLTFDEVIVEEGIVISDISSEEIRIYEFEDYVIAIDFPIALHIRDSGAHVVVEHTGETVYVPAGWDTLRWTAKPGLPHISF